MTTRVKFEEFVIRKFEHLKNQRLNYDSKTNSYDDFYTDSAWAGWQACQDLNNAERESLLAENAMMREALNCIRRDTAGLYQDTTAKSLMNTIIDIRGRADKALAAKPRLVEVGNVSGDDVFIHNDLKGFEGKLYTIQKG